MNRIKTFLAIALMSIFSMGAMATVVLVENATEVAVSNTTLPTYSGGSVVVQACSECPTTTLPVDANTEYFIGFDTTAIPLAELRQTVAAGQYELMYIFSSTDTGVVTRIVLGL